MPNEVFLSHANPDLGFAARLADVLKRHGVSVWFSQTNVLGAQQWQDEIGNALSRCDWFVVILSPNSVDSMWVKRETAYFYFVRPALGYGQGFLMKTQSGRK